jgi:HAD superfamily hydrolase (TIGR01484 family)
MNELPSAIVFDLDMTLAESKQPILPGMANLLAHLSLHIPIAVISGGALEQLQHQVIEELPPTAELRNIYLLPTSGAAMYLYEDESWTRVYEEELSPEEVAHIEDVIEEEADATKLIDFSTESYGERIEFRGAQVTLSALGQEAPIAEKQSWDPDGAKKKILRDAIQKVLPEYDVKAGGSTSIDVTKKGINKTYGLIKFSEYLKIPLIDMLYVGDALYPGGNDEVVKQTNIKTQEVGGPNESETFIKAMLEKVNVK